MPFVIKSVRHGKQLVDRYRHSGYFLSPHIHYTYMIKHWSGIGLEKLLCCACGQWLLC